MSHGVQDAPGPAYRLVCETREGRQVELHYRPHASILTDAAGAPLLADTSPEDFDPVHAVHPGDAAGKTGAVDTLKIQLGMRCNYACSYCNQASTQADALVTRTADVDDFLARLPGWLTAAPRRIEFWGGEPLLYFAKLRRLVPELRRRFPQATFFMVTNGTLLDGEILDFIERHDLSVAVSHDAAGQGLRGKDPFDDPRQAAWLRELWRRRGGPSRGRVSVNVVLTPANADIAATRRWLAGRFGDEDIALDTEGAVSVYDDRTLHGAGHWREEDYATMHESIAQGFLTGDALRFDSIRLRARDFVRSLQQQRPASAVGQKCGMDRPDQLAVDLLGRVMTCQNTGASGRHHLGSVHAMASVRLATATHWRHRDACTRCPVVQLCKGGCMYLDGPHFQQTCANEYRFNLAILDGVLRRVAGLELVRIEGDIGPRPPRKVIPLVAEPATAG